MAQNKKAAEAAGPRARLEIEFEQPHLLGPLFGEFDRNLVAIEDRLGVYIAARGAKVQIEGDPEAAARAREVLLGLYNRLDEGHDIDAETVNAIIAMSGQPTLDGIIAPEVIEPPKVMIRTRKKTIVPRSKAAGRLYGGAGPRRHDLRARARRAPARPISPSPRRCSS